MITVAITVTSRRPGFTPPEPDEQTYSSYENAARGLEAQRLNVPTDTDRGIHWGRTERGHQYTATLIDGERRDFDAAMWARADLSTAGRRLADARRAVDEVMLEAETLGIKALRAGQSESHVARELGVDRMTVRKWQGKR
ncbi:hypothetical protein [Nocardia vulneris]|uniref:hypothetical protein n=1 Tax=Nocardia vulneris TaxID=1141657 RepID=UPI00068B105F|nr:hypothetical protein [Nocardia vulneris]